MPKVKPLRRSTRTTTTLKPTTKSTPGRPSLRQRKTIAPQSPPKTSTSRRTRNPPTLSPLSRTPQQLAADPNPHLPLFALPPEINQHITSFLPLSAETCLTLTCKHAASIVGTKSWAAYKTYSHLLDDQQENENFLDLLLKELGGEGSGYEHCERCSIIHPNAVKPPRTHKKTKYTLKCLGQDAVVDYLPKDDEGKGYELMWEHVREAFESSDDGFYGRRKEKEEGPEIELLAGDFTIVKKTAEAAAGTDVSWRLESSGKRVDGRLIVKHVHTFRGGGRSGLTAKQVLDLPVRLCPHQSTTTHISEPSHYIKSLDRNTPLLTHVISSAFPTTPTSLRKGVDTNLNLLKPPTNSEQEKIDAAVSNIEGNYVYRCRFCPTKFSAEYTTGGLNSKKGLSITSWHCLGSKLFQASKYWGLFVRRTGPNLGTGKRNDEWWSRGMSGPDFRCE